MVYERNNKSFVSLKENFNGQLRNEAYILDKHICAKKDNKTVKIGQCDCKNCVDIFDHNLKYSFAKRKICNKI